MVEQALIPCTNDFDSSVFRLFVNYTRDHFISASEDIN